jgi:hypothetical protein
MMFRIVLVLIFFVYLNIFVFTNCVLNIKNVLNFVKGNTVDHFIGLYNR